MQRQQTEHAIAVLAGMAPSELTIAPTATAYNPPVPTPPLELPSQVLQRRPDIASAERSAASASAAIGVQVAAYFPTISLSGSYGFNATNLSTLFNSGNDVWSYGANLAETVLDFGARRARVKQAKAVYAERVAAYRQTVLTAFQGVEDQLVALRVLEGESKIRDQELVSARLAQTLALNRYRAGQVDYTTVAAAQAQALSSAQNVLNLARSRQNASVALIEALGRRVDHRRSAEALVRFDRLPDKGGRTEPALVHPQAAKNAQVWRVGFGQPVAVLERKADLRMAAPGYMRLVGDAATQIDEKDRIRHRLLA